MPGAVPSFLRDEERNPPRDSQLALPLGKGIDDEWVESTEERQVVRKCDLRVLPPVLLLFMLSVLNRINFQSARGQLFSDGSVLDSLHFNVASQLLFVTLILLAIPSNAILKNSRPSIWLSLLLFGCGILNICAGIVQSFGALVACRLVLGGLQAGLVPGAIYFVSMYYKRYELASRLCWLFVSALITYAFEGLLASAIDHMDGLRGYAGWRWVLILEGTVTATIALPMNFFFVDWPETATFLNEQERFIVVQRVLGDKSESAQMNWLDKPAFKRIIGDWKIWAGFLIYIGAITTNYTVRGIMPTVLDDFHHPNTSTKVRALPVYGIAALFCLTTSYASDRLKNRFGFICFGVLFGASGYLVLLFQSHVSVGVRYMALCFVTSAALIVEPIVVSWLMNNVGGHYKRAFASSAQVGLGGAGGVIAANIFPHSDYPTYSLGYGVSLGLLLMSGAVATLMVLKFTRENKARWRGRRAWRFGLKRNEAENLGDDHPTFRFAA